VSGTGLLVDRPADGVTRLRMQRPDTRNALDRGLAGALSDAFGKPDAAVVILAGGEDAFCSGLDLNLDPSERVAVSDLLYQVYERMLSCPVPIVTSIAGHAVGGGAQLAIASDLRVASPSARIRFVGTGHGLAVGAWGLASLVGRGRAMDLCLSMRSVPADEAHTIGLVDRLEDDPDAGALELATHIASLDGSAVARVKRLVGDAGLLDALRREREENLATWSGEIPDAALPSATRDDV
jgi:enoyl-CoA hydratase/carnithine racemase